MKYDLVKVAFGTSNPSRHVTIDTDETDVTDFCCIDEDNYIFTTERHIGLIRGGEVLFPWFSPKFGNIQSIAYNAIYSGCYVLARQGADCFFLEMEDPYMRVASDTVSTTYHYLLKSFNKLGCSGTVSSVLLDSGILYFVNSALNRGFKVKESTHKSWIGTGRPEYAVSNRLESCSIASPMGIDYVDNTLYIADSANGCIRAVSGNDVSIFIGNPSKLYVEDGTFDSGTFEYPTAFKIRKGMCYILDCGRLRYAMVATRTIGTVCNIPEAIMLEMTPKRGAIVLVRS